MLGMRAAQTAEPVFDDCRAPAENRPGEEPARRTAAQAVQLHGGYGFMMESSVRRSYCHVTQLEIGEGASQIQRNVIAKQLRL